MDSEDMRILEITHIRGNLYKITKQSPRTFKTFFASNGFELKSCTLPEIKNNMLYCQGSGKNYDDELLEIPDKTLKRLKVALREYNKLIDYKYIKEQE